MPRAVITLRLAPDIREGVGAAAAADRCSANAAIDALLREALAARGVGVGPTDPPPPADGTDLAAAPSERGAARVAVRLRIDPVLHDAVRRVADSTVRTGNATIEVLLREALRRRRKASTAPGWPS